MQRMNDRHLVRSYLLVVSKPDAAKLEAGLKSVLHKLGDTVYLASFYTSPDLTYLELKAKYGIAGEIQWFQLPDAWVTR